MFVADSSIKGIVCIALNVYFWILFIRVLSSWFPPPREGPLKAVVNLLYEVTDPVLKPLRNLIPPVRSASMAMDFSPILAFVIIFVARLALHC
jgi:YggT family protein